MFTAADLHCGFFVCLFFSHNFLIKWGAENDLWFWGNLSVMWSKSETTPCSGPVWDFARKVNLWKICNNKTQLILTNCNIPNLGLFCFWSFTFFPVLQMSCFLIFCYCFASWFFTLLKFLYQIKGQMYKQLYFINVRQLISGLLCGKSLRHIIYKTTIITGFPSEIYKNV